MKKLIQNIIAFAAIFLLLFVTKGNAQKPELRIQVSTGTAQSISFSPDESMLFANGILWDVVSGKQLHIFKNAMAGCFSKDGKALIIFTENKVFKMVDFMGNEIKILSQTANPVYFTSGTIYPESGLMLTTDKLINIYTGEVTLIKGDGFHSRDYGMLKNKIALGGEDRKVTICNSKNGQLLETITIPALHTFEHANSLNFSKDNNLLLAASSGSEGTVSIYSFLKNDFISTFKYPYDFYAVALSPDGKKFMIVGKKITMADTKTGKTIWESENSHGFKTVFFNEKGNKVILSGNDALTIFNNDNGVAIKKFKILPLGDIAGSFHLVADDNELNYRPTNNEVIRWDFTNGLMLKPYAIDHYLYNYLPSRNGSKIFTFQEIDAKKSLVEYDLMGNTQPRVYPYSGNMSSINRFALSYNSEFLLFSTADEYTNMLNIWDVSTHENVAVNLTHDHQICAFANTGNILAAINNSNKNPKNEPVEFYEIPSGKLLNTLTLEGADLIADNLMYSKTDKYLLARQQKNLSLIDIEKRSIHSIPNVDSTLMGLSYTFTPDDKYFVKGTRKGNIEFYNIANKEWEVAKTINANGGNIEAVDFSKNGIYLFIASNNTISVWNWETKKLLATLYSFPKTNDWAVLTPDGHFDASAGAQENMYYVKNVNTIALADMYEKFFTPHLLPRILNGEKINGEDINIDDIHIRPVIKIQYAEKRRNLEVGDDNTVYANTTGVAVLTIRATAKDDKVDEIRLFHNGKVVNLNTRGLFVTDNDGSESKKYSINLLPGNNSFRAIALNSQRTESDADEIVVSYSANGNQPAPQPVADNDSNIVIDQIDKTATMYLMVVGINAYTNKINPLTYALPDATAFKEEIEKDAKSVLANVKTYFITDAKADKAGIISAFDAIKKDAKPQDVFVFYYAGHGYINPANKEFYLVSANVTDAGESLLNNGIRAKELQEYAIGIQAQKQIFVLDACQSAGAFEAMLKHDGEQQKSLAVVARSTGTHWMAASGSTETAKEFGQLGHGAFTYVLLQALKGQAAANKMITVNGLKNYLQVQVPELVKKYGSNNQYPASYGFGNDFPVELIK